jgi:hypothetical protein
MSEPSSPPAKQPLNPWSIWIPIIMVMLGVVVFYNWLIFRQRQEMDLAKAEAAGMPSRPPIMSRLSNDLELTERSGKKVHLAELRGKILVTSWRADHHRVCVALYARHRTAQARISESFNHRLHIQA